MDQSMLPFFLKTWNEVPTVWLDVETTGTDVVNDRACQVGIARFEGERCVSMDVQLVDPGRPIPAEATAIHGITDDMVRGMPPIQALFALDKVQTLLAGAQPGAYNGPFDRHFIPPFGDWTWPWLDCLSLVRKIDRYAKGKGRHKLEASCKRHGVTLTGAHDAGHDARAAGELFYKLVPKLHSKVSLGGLLKWQRIEEASEWYRFFEWLSEQPRGGAA